MEELSLLKKVFVVGVRVTRYGLAKTTLKIVKLRRKVYTTMGRLKAPFVALFHQKGL